MPCSMELFEPPGLMVPQQRRGWPLLCSIHDQQEGRDEKQLMGFSFPLSLSQDNVKAGFLKSSSELVALFDLTMAYETVVDWNILLKRCIFASIRCCSGMCYSDRCHWRRLMEVRLQIRLQKLEFQWGRALEGVSWWKGSGACLMLSAKVGGGIRGTSGQGFWSCGDSVCHLPLLLSFE